jgi:hypothetical protein
MIFWHYLKLWFVFVYSNNKLHQWMVFNEKFRWGGLGRHKLVLLNWLTHSELITKLHNNFNEGGVGGWGWGGQTRDPGASFIGILIRSEYWNSFRERESSTCLIFATKLHYEWFIWIDCKEFEILFRPHFKLRLHLRYSYKIIIQSQTKINWNTYKDNYMNDLGFSWIYIFHKNIFKI